MHRTELEILPNPLVRIAPLVLGLIAMIWGIMASLIPNVIGRVAAWATIIGVVLYFISR
jgi:hypothetical protein